MVLPSPTFWLRAMEDLKEKWRQLKLSEAKGNEIVIKKELLMEKIQLGSKSLVGKIHSERSLYDEIFRSTMSKVWKMSKSFMV